MISLNTSFQGCVAACCTALPIIGDFYQPEYHIGQLVLHRICRPAGETLYPVHVIGVFWSGFDWQYAVELSQYHPWFEVNDREVEWVDFNELQLM